MEEVDQITVLKDVNSAIQYGSRAVNGVVMITTKKGKAFKQQLKVNGYYGVSVPLALPKYLSSADYMVMYNEARENDGLADAYDQTTIDNYRTGNKYRYPDVDYYSSDKLNSYKPFSKISTELSGGNNVATYYLNLGWEHSGSLLNFGEGKNSGENKFNIRSNVDMNINKYVKTSINARAVFDNVNAQTGDYWGNASTLRPNLYSPLIPIDLVAASAMSTVIARKTDVNGIYLLGGTSSYQTNGIAESYVGGNNETIRRDFSFHNKVDVDLSPVTKGLSFHTNFGFDLITKYNQGIDNSYSVYTPTWDANVDSIIRLTQYGTDARSGTQNVTNQYFVRRFSYSGTLNYDRTFNDAHHFFGTLSGFGNKYKVQGDEQGQKDIDFGLQMTYVYNKKYMIDFNGVYLNSVMLPTNKKMALSPSLGLAWVISSENFMSSLTFVDYLKIRATAGILNSDNGIDGFYYYDDSYTTSGSYNWYEGTYSNSGVISSHGANRNLAFEKRNELNLGFEGSFFNRLIEIDANAFISRYYDQITRPSTVYPSFYSTILPYKNFDCNGYRGAELGLILNKNLGGVNVSLGANALYSTSKVIRRDEIYSNDYQYRKGKTLDSRFALVADGFFQDEDDIAGHAYQTFGTVKPGDIKYIDQNNDGLINSDDQVRVGRSQAPFSYGLNLTVSYKNWTLFAQGDGRNGADNFMSSSYYWVDGDDKYSEIVLNRWTPDTKETATYPRLSSVSNSNNFQNSTFWLYRDNYFDLQRVQLTYNFPASIYNMLSMKNLSCYLDASNVWLFSKNRDTKELNVGSEPQYRSFSFGIKTTF